MTETGPGHNREAYWEAVFRQQHATNVDGTLELARLMRECFEDPDAGPAVLVRAGQSAGYSKGSVSKLCAVAKADSRFHSVKQRLPYGWGTLYQLAQLSDDEWNAALAADAIRPDMTRADARALQSPDEVDDDLEDLPPGTYRTLVVDPPWPMQKIVRDVAPNQVGFDYPTMSLQEIKAWPVAIEATCEAAHLYVWTTQKFLPETFEIVSAWGFDYIFTMVWHKPGGFQPYGLPQFNAEFCVFARKGGLPFLDTTAFPVCFNAARREHSRKPDEFYDLVRRVSPGPRVDIFSRESREGFDSYGNEAVKFDSGAAA